MADSRDCLLLRGGGGAVDEAAVTYTSIEGDSETARYLMSPAPN